MEENKKESEENRFERMEANLNEEQMANIKIRDGLLSKYPDAFSSMVDEKSREVLIMSRLEESSEDKQVYIRRDVLIGQEGVYEMTLWDFEGGIDDVDMTKLNDCLEDRPIQILPRTHGKIWGSPDFGLAFWAFHY